MSCGQNNVFSIFTGDAKPMSLKALYAQSFSPLDLTECTEIVINLPNADGTVSALKLSLNDITITSPSVLGNFVASADAIGGVSAVLNVGELQTFTVVFTISGNQMTVPYVNALSVFETA